MPELGLGFQAMDSPETSKLTTVSTSDSPPVQDSPFFNYISNLSPIVCTRSRSTHVTREFSRLNSPPIVFKSPRRKEPSETNVLKRSRSLQLSSPQPARSIEEGAGVPVDTKRFIIRNGLITQTHKGCDVAGSSETPPSSSSGCVDEFLADVGEGDCVSSGKLATPTVKHNDATASYQGGSKDLKDTALKFDNKNGSWMNVDENLDEPLVFLENAEKHSQGGSEPCVKSERTDVQKDATWPSHRFPNIRGSSHVSHALKKSHQNSQAQGVQHEHGNNLECVPHPAPEPFPLQINKDHSEDVGGISDGLVGTNIPHIHEVNESHRGVRRRCLQFEEAHLSSVRCNVRSSDLEKTVCSSKRSTSAVDLETLESRNAETKGMNERLLVNLPQPTPLPHIRSSENSSIVSKPLGIGLHLNSIVNAASLGCTATASKKSTDHDIVTGIVTGGIKSGPLESTSSCSTSFRVMEKDSTTNEERICSTKSLVVASPVTFQFPHPMKDPYLAQDENENSNAHKLEKTDQTSPRKKRKKATSSFDGDGCKNCNCKKSKCLKLYCDCFAAGIYCSDPCACQGCFNKPEYKDKVLEVREQIESRNPLAFAPKIVQHISELPPNNGEDGSRATPSSARHKRGCNCKKSMCLKKYCECYQANVGCSSGCRCEGCKNVYGRKEEYSAIEHGATREVMSDVACKERLERTTDSDLMVEFRGDLLCDELINPLNLTPVTPSFQHSDNGKDAGKSRFLSKRYLPSPDSNLSILSSNEKPTKSPPRGIENNDDLFETHEDVQTEGSSDRQMNNNMGKLGSNSSGSNVVCRTELSDPAIPIISISRRKDCIAVLGNDHLLSRSLTRPGSPLTPMTSLGGTKLSQVPDSCCELVDILETNHTPVKVSSPNKKRVSPPHSRIYKLGSGSGSSGGIRSGRKFILKSVPSFPPLTPCIDSKGSSITQDTKMLQGNNSTINK